MSTGITPAPRRFQGVDLGDPGFSEKISAGLRDVEKLLEETLNASEPFIADKVRHLAQAGGKRFRPMMALLASHYGQRPNSLEVIKAAVIVELVHLATLYHDDVMDEAEKRRGVDSANLRWGNSVAILAGDILLAYASRLMSELDTRTVAHFADTFEKLVTGQMRETIGSSDGLGPIAHYRHVIHEKTGVLIASAGYLGAIHAHAEEPIADALYQLGAIIGAIFQIVDDIIDIFSTSGESGKTPGTDLREGVFTLPVLYALEEESEVGEELRSLLTGPLEHDAEVERALDLLARSQARQRTLGDIEQLRRQADEQLARLPEGSATNALKVLVEYTINRVG